ncbi:MAG: phosphoribosylglycinamide formyltransferase [Lysobacterales bacterium]
MAEQATTDCHASTHLRVAVLVSGHGSNLQALIDARDKGLPVDLVGVFSDRANAPALKRAGKAGIAAMCLRVAEFGDEATYQRALFATVAASRPQLVVCAGFMRIIGEAALASSVPMINIHPSLLPKYRGLDTYRRTLEAGDKVHGASVHRVTKDLDGGPLIAQVRIPIARGDDAVSLARRLLPLEHRLLVACVRAIAHGDVAFASDGGVLYRGATLDRPLQLATTHHDALQKVQKGDVGD